MKRTLANGQVVDRYWMLYSPSQNSIFCFVCRLFGSHDTTNVFVTIGLSNFHNITRDIQQHESSKNHSLNELAYKGRCRESKVHTIDDSILNQSEIEREYWKSILKRIVVVIKFLGSRGLPFRGADQTCGSIRNGNFLGILDLLSKFDPLLASHIAKYGNKGRGIFYLSSYVAEFSLSPFELTFTLGRASYLSDTICDEFINLIGTKVLNAILTEIREAKYFSISVDSTPDVSHSDQLVFCVRYVKNGTPIERFLQFVHINQHKAEYLTNTVVNFMSKNSINLADCRGQSYDNASNMAGKYSGLQQRILELNKFAVFLPCASHSLNLVGAAAVSTNHAAVSFFSFLESIYSFFVVSSSRWDLLQNALESDQLVLKRSTGTRWSAKVNSVNALNGNIKTVKGVLLQLINDDNLQTDAINKVKAAGLLGELCNFENILMLKIWYAILVKFEMVNKTLQKSDLDLSVAVKLYKSLICHCENLITQFDDFFYEAKSMFVELDAEQHTLKSRSTITLDNMDEKKNSLETTIFTPVIETLISHLKIRMDCYVQADEKFSFLTKLDQLDSNQISTACQTIASFYTDDIDEKELISECLMAKNYFFTDSTTFVSHRSLYSRIIEDDVQTVFPNIEIILRIFLSLFVTNVPDERAFSKLKLIKNILRNSLTDEKLNLLSLMSIEHEILDSLDLDEIIEEFVLLKNRRKIKSD